LPTVLRVNCRFSDEAVEPFVGDMKRYLEMKLELEAPARQFCHGILSASTVFGTVAATTS
jgi:hypothetical protein